MYLNRVTIAGKVLDDPTFRQIEGGGELCSFRIATVKRWYSRAGKPSVREDIHRVSVLAAVMVEFARCHVFAGVHLLIEGELQARPFVNGEGKPSASIEIAVCAPTGALAVYDPVSDARHDRASSPHLHAVATS